MPNPFFPALNWLAKGRGRKSRKRTARKIQSVALLPPAIHESEGLTAHTLLYHLFSLHGSLARDSATATLADRQAFQEWQGNIPTLLSDVVMPCVPLRMAVSANPNERLFCSGPAFLWQSILDWFLKGKPSWAPASWPLNRNLSGPDPTPDDLCEVLYILGVSDIDLQALKVSGINPNFWPQMRQHASLRGGLLFGREDPKVSTSAPDRQQLIPPRTRSAFWLSRTWLSTSCLLKPSVSQTPSVSSSLRLSLPGLTSATS